jgi:hypothetical protein
MNAAWAVAMCEIDVVRRFGGSLQKTGKTLYRLLKMVYNWIIENP